MKWRHWWIDSIKENNVVMEHVSFNNPPAIFKDVTMDLREMIADIDDAKISVIMRTCDKHVIPTVLCPWGESEFLHTCGDVPFDSVLQRYMTKCYFKKVSKDKDCGKIYSSREDYIREEIEDYDNLLLNPSWSVRPSVAFIEGKGPVVLTCNEHNGGTHKLYVHPPRQPYHIIPSEKGDQLCHAVIKPHLIKPMKASKYCIKFQMHEQQLPFEKKL